ncbi:hypothetical protein AB0C29_04640 [Actinoplanes sp. NPDC048791]|uniref:hypothetical protein n=1 Tax=Actinoplanes sp. NPDC048791 TaxID=3154623 RepID=UPI0033FDDB51
MPHELSDMLQEAKSDAPPPRYSVQDALTAGRKRQQRRRALWAGTGSAAVVLAVTGAVAVPQLLPAGNDKSTTVNAGAAPSKAGKPAKVPFAYPSTEFSGTFAKYKVGDLTVDGTVLVTPGYQVASITAPGKGQAYEDENGGRYYAPNVIGHVVTYAKGAFDPAKAKKDPKAGAGYFHAGEKKEAIKPGIPAPYAESTYTWKYADDAWAQVIVQGGLKYPATKLASIAEGLTGSAEKPVKVGIKLGYVPAGFELGSAGTTSDYLEASFAGTSFLRLIKGDFPYKKLTGTVGDPFIVQDTQLPILSLQVYPAREQKYTSPGNAPYCPQEGLCYRYTADKKFFVELNGGGFIGNSEMIKMLKSVEFADPTDSSTWFAATEAVS